MKNRLYYFSATGNSLRTAQKLHEKLDGFELLSISSDAAEGKIQADSLGIVCPIYMYQMPHIVVDFIQRIHSADYIFVIFTGAGKLGTGVAKSKKLFRKRELTLNALFNIPLPNNYTPYGCPDQAAQKQMFVDADRRIGEIVSVIKRKATFFDQNRTGFIQSYIHPGLLYQLAYPHISKMDRNFRVDDSCNGCAICEKVCPVDNIAVSGDKPHWDGRCQQCYACLQWCPKSAIQSGRNTAAIDRYHHPEISVKDIIASMGK